VTDWTSDRTLDARNLACPLPVLKTRKVLAALPSGGTLLVEATDPMAAIDIPHFCKEAGHLLIGEEKRDGILRFLIRRA
jgi:tRNA 2-thiouridine synthesizing protein A